MRRQHAVRYYIFSDAASGKKYFHNTVTNEITWCPPKDSLIIDPETLKTINFDFSTIENTSEIVASPSLQKYSVKRKSKIGFRKISLPNLPSTNALGTFKGNRKSTLIKLSSKDDLSPTSSSKPPIYLPTQITQDSLSFDVRKFATENFNTRMRGSIFSKKEIPPDELLVYDTDSSVLPILKITPNTLQKQCIEIFKFIMDYCKQLPKAQPNVLVELIYKDKNLVDETFIYLLKFLHNNPNPENVLKVWDLILVVCTFFPPRPLIQPLVRHFIAKDALGTKSGINTVAKIAYIRLAARCDCNETFPMQPAKWINMIPTHPSVDTFVFGAPLLELVFAQRKTMPKCTIPLFMHRFLHELDNAGIEKMEGSFRLPGNKIQVDLMVDEINLGKESYRGAELNDLASVFKRWLADLPEPIIPMAMYNELVAACTNKTIMEFIEKLPKVNHDTLGYLVGFLQKFVKHADKTKMGTLQCAMIFGANVVRIVSDDPMIMKISTDYGKEFMTHLIENWDTSFIYPLPIEFCDRSDSKPRGN